MKKKIILLIFLFIPFIKVNALNCYKNEIDITKVDNFPCYNVGSDKLTFSYNDEDYSKYFNYSIDSGENGKEATITLDKNLSFDSAFEKGFIIISDGTDKATITVKNKAYVKTTKQEETTTTTKDVTKKEITVILDDGNNKKEEKCTISSGQTYCNITLPKLDVEGFTGWGTASTCKEGSIGSTKVEKNITYYACNEKNSNTETSSTIYLKTLKLTNKDTNEEIKIGTFSIKKTEYEIKVLNDVENINVEATSDENVKIDITGNENLKVGENEIIIKLTNDSNETNEYRIKVNRLNVGETISNIHYLKSLVIGGGYNINFNKNTFNYTITIPNEITKLEITPVVENTSDRYEILNNTNLVNGSIIKINVIGDNNETTTYNINIVKEKQINYLIYIGLGAVLLLIIILIILIIIKSNKKKKNNISPKTLNNNRNDIEVLNI